MNIEPLKCLINYGKIANKVRAFHPVDWTVFTSQQLGDIWQNFPVFMQLFEPAKRKRF